MFAVLMFCAVGNEEELKLYALEFLALGPSFPIKRQEERRHLITAYLKKTVPGYENSIKGQHFSVTRLL